MSKVITITAEEHRANYLDTRTSNMSLAFYQECAQEFHATGHVQTSKGDLKNKSWLMSLRMILVLLLICASLATGVAPIVILSLRMDKEVDNLSGKLASQVAQTVVAWVNQLIVPGPAMCDTVVRMFDDGLLSSHLESGLESPEVTSVMRLLWGTFRDGRQSPIKMLYMGTEYDAFLGFVNKGADGIWMRNRTAPEVLAPGPGLPAPPFNSTPLEASTAFLALGGSRYNFSKKMPPIAPFFTRQRGWYSTFAYGNRTMGWFGPYTYANGAVGLSPARRLYNSSGSFIGVIAADVELDGIHSYLSSSQMRLSPGMHHTIIDIKGNLMGTSLSDAIATEKGQDGQVKLVNILDPRQPQDLQHIMQFLLDKDGAFSSITTNGQVERWGSWYIFAMMLEDSYGLQWIYILYAPTSDFLGPGVTSMVTAIGICIGFVAAIILLALIFAYRISRQLSILTEDMKRATALSLSHIQTEKESTHLEEVAAMSVEFRKLVNGLRSFRKYLPQDQVGFLLRSNLEANMAAIEEEITVLFLDIQDFTTIVEGMDKGDVVHFYGAVMTQITDTVMEHEGTLDKYIGDAVMAFWNMPRRVPDHETKAVKAALACRHLLPNLSARGWPVDFRVGISTGYCQVGNFGSKVRLNYTAIGDTVNLASRLEGLCKLYGTRTLLCGSTFKGLDTDLFVIRHIDNVTVKGKGNHTAIYEAMALRSEATDAMLTNCATYEQAFSLYCQRAYDEAETIWTRAAARNDKTANMMLQRLPTVRHQTNFDGVWKWTTK